ncbi:MAG: hypothetical protein M0C28_23185 [Candidatus Moduliflexus flocculans]|nr:hypothetical protein [Candidatus Moduliflexus flocculans]
MALSMHLYTLATQVPNVTESLPYATAVVLLGLGAARQRRRHRAARLAARRGRSGDAVTARRTRDRGRGPAPRLRRAARSSTASRSTSSRNEILGVIGPAQSGKTSLLRCLNRTIDFIARRHGVRARSGWTARTCGGCRTSSPCAARSAWWRRCRSGCR